jgi:hypothetical protein
MAEDDEEEERKQKSDKKSPHTAIKSPDSTHNNNNKNSSSSSSNSNSNVKGATQSGTSSSNYSNIHGIDSSTTHPVPERKPFQSTRDMRVVFVGKPFEMVIVEKIGNYLYCATVLLLSFYHP